MQQMGATRKSPQKKVVELRLLFFPATPMAGFFYGLGKSVRITVPRSWNGFKAGVFCYVETARLP
jgi:hypothetical protein